MPRTEVETLPYSERSGLVLGGSSGIGLEAVVELKRLGVARIFVGTTSLENFTRAMDLVQRRRKVDISLGVYPFVAHVDDKLQLAQAAAKMKSIGLVGEELDVIASQSSGMQRVTEEIFKEGGHIDSITEHTFETPIDELDDADRAVVEQKLEAMRKDVAVLNKEALPQALAVNCHGTLDAFEMVDDTFPDTPKRRVVYNSTWGHLSGNPGVQIPLLYRPIDLSKARLRDLLATADPPATELVASLVNDTKVGKMFNDFLLNLMLKEQREAVRNSSIFARDVVAATKLILEDAQAPRVLFVYGKDGQAVITDHLELSPMYTTPYLF